jgi:hypothetical protein
MYRSGYGTQTVKLLEYRSQSAVLASVSKPAWAWSLSGQSWSSLDATVGPIGEETRMKTTDEIRELENKVRDLVGVVRELEARVGKLEKKLDKLNPPPGVARILEP